MIDLLEIKDPSFVKDLTIKELKDLATQIRTFLVENISKTGGHLSSNLGVVEITIAMYYVFDPEKDKFLFDVGHQSYVHKILTGRAKDFVSLRQIDGLSGYIKRSESKYDIWESGHSSTSISAMAGMLVACDDKTGRYVSLIGDSAIINGVAFEGLNFLGSDKSLAPIIILNDNKMGISKSVGAFSKVLARLRGAKPWRAFKRFLNIIFPTFITNWFHRLKRGLKAFIQRDNIFEDMGFDYYGPIRGNDLRTCIKYLQRVKKNNEPVILHIITKKGLGYGPSEADSEGLHGVGPFDISTGKPLHHAAENEYSYSELVASFLMEKRKMEEFFVITPAMKYGSNLGDFAAKFPKNFYDVGIAEEHAADMAAGIALSGKKVVLLYYSTFAQRAYDQLLNDISRQNLPVIIGIDRAGIVGEDGPTHQGIYDIAMLQSMPNMQIAMPRNAQELVAIFNYAFKFSGPIAIRYPRLSSIVDLKELDYSLVSTTNWEVIIQGTEKCVISYGPDVDRLKDIIESEKLPYSLINAKFIRPLDTLLLAQIANDFKDVLVVEQVVKAGSLWQSVLSFFEQSGQDVNVQSIAIPTDTIVVGGKIADVLERYGLDNKSLAAKLKV